MTGTSQKVTWSHLKAASDPEPCVCQDKVHGPVVLLPPSGRKHKPSAAGQDGQESTRNQQKAALKEPEAAGTQLSVSTGFDINMS